MAVLMHLCHFIAMNRFIGMSSDTPSTLPPSTPTIVEASSIDVVATPASMPTPSNEVAARPTSTTTTPVALMTVSEETKTKELSDKKIEDTKANVISDDKKMVPKPGLDGRTMYCGRRYDVAGACLCGSCDGICGETGCPCDDCMRINIHLRVWHFIDIIYSPLPPSRHFSLL
jgi:hypothetical protein